MRQKGYEYFKDKWNLGNIVSIICNTFLLADHVFNFSILDKDWTVTVAVCAVLLLWLQLFYWFRLFETTNLFVELISQTIHDAFPFFCLFVFTLTACANAIFIVNKNRTMGDDGDQLYEEVLDISIISSLLNQYLFTLGEFRIDNFSKANSKNTVIVWVLFVFSTVFSYILIMNMMIAIMEDTYERVF